MEHTAVFQEQIPLMPKDMRQKIESIDELLLTKLKGRLEGRCSQSGFVVPGSIKILGRSMGVLEKGRFTGSVLFHVQAEGTVLNPPDGVIVEGEVSRKNKMGMYVVYQVKAGTDTVDAIKIIVPRDLHLGDETYDTVEVGQQVRVEIKKSRFQVNDPYIQSIGIFQEVVTSRAETKTVPEATPEAPEAEAEAATSTALPPDWFYKPEIMGGVD
jgi:DNA-directed RNA polymerase subunit E'/Rpb7